MDATVTARRPLTDDIANHFIKVSDAYKQKQAKREARLADMQAQLDVLCKEAAADYQAFADDMDAKLAATKLPVQHNQFVRPASVRLSPDQLILAVGDDHLLVVQRDSAGQHKTHHFGPPDVQNQRTCTMGGCQLQIGWASEPVAIL